MRVHECKLKKHKIDESESSGQMRKLSGEI